MSAYVLTPLAKADIFNIWCYIAAGSEDAADRVEQAIYAACALVAEAPMRGHSRLDLTTRSVRFWTLHPLPKLRHCLPAGNSPSRNRRRDARKEKYPAHPETKAVNVASCNLR